MPVRLGKRPSDGLLDDDLDDHDDAPDHHDHPTDHRESNAALHSSATDVRVEDNLLDGGGCILNFDHTGIGRPLTGIYVVP